MKLLEVDGKHLHSCILWIDEVINLIEEKPHMETFDVLERMFPSNLFSAYAQNSRQQVTLEHQITINGAPIGDCLAAMMSVIRSQQRTIEDLRQHIESQSTDAVQRVDRLERYVTLLTRDVKLDNRPIPAYGQGPMPTLADSVTTVEYRLTQLENKRRQMLLRQVTDIANRCRMRGTFEQWVLVARAKGMMRDLFLGQLKRTQLRYYQKWTRYLAASKADQVNRRRVRALNYLSSKGLVQRYYDKWRRFILQSREDKIARRLGAAMKVEGMGAVSNRSIARRYLVKWTQFVSECRSMQFRVKFILQLESDRSRAIAVRYLGKWSAHHRLTKALQQRLTVVNQQSAKAFRALALRYLANWKDCSKRRLMRRQTRAVIPRMHHLQLVALARRYFLKMEMYSKWIGEKREKEAMQLAIQQLARRCDALGAQLDLGLQTLSHTNGVLSKVLEHVSFNSSWEKKRASSTSPQRFEDPVANVHGAAPTTQHRAHEAATGVSGRGGWSTAGVDDGWLAPSTTADDILLQLRSRLQKMNDVPQS